MSFMALGAVELIFCKCEKSVYLVPFGISCKNKYFTVKDCTFLSVQESTVFFSYSFYDKWYQERYP